MLYPNQRGIRIHREIVKSGTKEKYLLVKYDNLVYAMNDLSNSAFKVYVYFITNKDNYIMGISPAAINKVTGVCLETSRKAIRELETKGYIVMSQSLKYDFFEVPHKDVDRFGIEEDKNKWLNVIENSEYKDYKPPENHYNLDDKEDWFN